MTLMRLLRLVHENVELLQHYCGQRGVMRVCFRASFRHFRLVCLYSSLCGGTSYAQESVAGPVCSSGKSLHHYLLLQHFLVVSVNMGDTKERPLHF